jgi:hypothetical protein
MDPREENRSHENGKARFLGICAILAVVYLGFSFAFQAFADPPTSPYLPGETLSPTCAPTSTNCTVEPPLFSTTTLPLGGILYVNDASGTIVANTSTLYWNASSSIFQIVPTPSQTTTSSLLLLGSNLIQGGNVSGTYIGINEPTASNADFLDFQTNSSTVLKIASSGAVTANEGAGVDFQVLSSAVPTVDVFHVANTAATAIATAGVNNIQSDFVGGTGAIKDANEELTVTAGPTSGSTWNALEITENTTTQAGVTENAIYVDPITNSTGTENAIWIGSGWQTGLVVAGNPLAQATSSLIQLASTTIQGGNAQGTFIGINPSSYTGDFLDFQVASSVKFLVQASGTTVIGTTTPAAGSLLTVAGVESLGISSSTEGQLVFFDSLTNASVTLQANTSTATSFKLTLPSTTGAAGQSLVTDGNGNLSWGSTGFTVIASTTTNLTLTTSYASVTTAGITPSSNASQVWITADLMASTTAATSTVNAAVFKTSACATQVGNAVTSTFQRASTTQPGSFELSFNVVDSPASTVKQNYWVCVKNITNANASIVFGEITLQEIRAGSDIAEDYNAATGTPMTAGDVVSPDPTIDAGVMQSETPYDSGLLGVISTQPGAVLGNNDPDAGSQVLVALAGRVPVNVTNENGSINIGDELTSSDIPGFTMRATEPGRAVGIALASFDPDPSSGVTTGSILMFVNPGWSLGSLTSASEIASSSWALEGVSSSTESALDQFTAYVQAALEKLGFTIENGIATVQGIVANQVSTNELCVQSTCINGGDLQNILDEGGSSSASSSSLTPTPTPTPTPASTPSPTPESNNSSSTIISTPTLSPSPTSTPDPTSTPTPTPSASPTPSPTPDPSAAPSPSPSPTPTP